MRHCSLLFAAVPRIARTATLRELLMPTHRQAFSRAALPAICLSMLAFCSAAAQAQDISWDAKYYNPQPSQGDVVLPLPCGAAMVFRPVAVPVVKPLEDYPIQVGQESEEWGFIEQTRPTFIAGSFTNAKDKKSRYYLMAKYELTKGQYEAIQVGKEQLAGNTDAQCPTGSNKGMEPITNISWFDAVAAANDYNIWLRKKASNLIPKEDDVVGFVRLPTEVEWEFAARGGLEVDSAQYMQPLYPMDGNLQDYEWFSGEQSSNGKVSLIGRLKPNPLGLHDILGNVAEMTQDSFRLNKLDRQHGLAGAYTVRGGHYQTAQAELRSAARGEESYYDNEGATKKKTIGMRLVMVAPILTSRNRIKAIEENWKSLGASEPADAQATPGQPSETLKTLTTIAAKAQDDSLKNELNELEQQLRASQLRQEEARDQSIRASLNLGAFLCTKLKDDGLFVQMLEKNYQSNCAIGTPDATCGKREAQLKEQQERLTKLSQYYASSLVDAATLYGNHIEKQVDVFDQTLVQNKQLTGLRPYLAAYWTHQKNYLKNKKIDASSWLSACTQVH